MKKLGRREWLLFLLFLLVLILTGIFASRAVRRAAYWHEHRDEQIRPWMSAIRCTLLSSSSADPLPIHRSGG
jgi:hypothetical protein